MPERDYSATPLPKKLGIGEDMKIVLVAAPESFTDLLGDLPETTTFTTRFSPATKLALCFVRSRADLSASLDLLTARLPKQGHVWIAHPKRTSRHHTDFTQDDVRSQALAIGLVDYKVCSIDSDWSGLKFAWRDR